MKFRKSRDRKSLELLITIKDKKFKTIPAFVEKMLTPLMIHSSFLGNQAESFDGTADKKIWEMAQKDCITRIIPKFCDTTAKYLRHEVNASPREP